jgi:DNA-binding winged helix-turn-helix (wHTH) protein/Tol biopolymer transport system component
MEYRFGPFRVQPLERRLLRDHAQVPLTPKAFELLLVLIEAAGHLLEKDQLMKRVWADAFVEDANLANNISLLRKVLSGGNGGEEYIETVPKRGYRFLAAVTRVTTPYDDQPVVRSPVIDGVAESQPLTSVRPAAPGRQPIRLARVVVACLAFVVIAILMRRSPAQISAPPIRFTVSAPSGTSLPPPFQPASPAMSPDGRRLAFRVLRGGESVIAVRALDGLETGVLAGSEGGVFPFWSPAGDEIAFFAGGKLKKASLSGGAVQTICDAADGYGGTWNRDGLILFAPSPRTGLFSVRATGGQPVQVTSPRGNETFHQHPQFLPDGRRFTFFASPDGIYLGSLDGGTPVRILTSRSHARYAPEGFVLFIRDSMLMAQPFDANRGRVIGDPLRLAEHVPIGGVMAGGQPVGGGALSVSENGVLAYKTMASIQWKLAWFDRSGKLVAPARPLPFGDFGDFEMSPDATQVAVGHSGDIWVVDLQTGQAKQITFRSAGDRRPIWSPDGQWLVFISPRHEAAGLYRKKVSGDLPEELLLGADPDRLAWPSDWKAQGVVFMAPEGGDVRKLPLGGDRKVDTLARAAVTEPDAKLSPDGRWLAYSSAEARSDRREVFVRSVSTPATYRISINGGKRPRWRPDGKELFYLAGDGTLTSVPIDAVATRLSPGAAQSLFPTDLASAPEGLQSFGITRDGQRILMPVAEDRTPAQSLVVVSNWPAALNRTEH